MVDIIIPTYKRSFLTQRAIQSVLKQTYTSFNLYIIEDGSSFFVDKYPVHLYDKRVIYISLDTNNGVAFARNYAASVGKSPYIAFLDSDDEWMPTKLEKQVLYLEKNPEIDWVHTNEKWIRDGVEVKQGKKVSKQGGFFMERLLQYCLIATSSVMFRRTLWDIGGGFPTNFKVCEDYALWLCLNLQYPIGFIEENLVVKYAGDWEQLSSTIEIDRQRVLALHRFYCLYKDHPSFQNIIELWHKEILYKIQILKKGALKYNKPVRYKQYQSWEDLFTVSNRFLINAQLIGDSKSS